MLDWKATSLETQVRGYYMIISVQHVSSCFSSSAVVCSELEPFWFSNECCRAVECKGGLIFHEITSETFGDPNIGTLFVRI
jgi:hypothetical protein